MATVLDVIFFSLIGGVVSLIGGLLLLSREKTAKRLAKYATPFAAGALLSAVFLDLLKEGVEQGDPGTVLMATLLGIVFFFMAERFLRWFHHHHEHDKKQKGDPAVSLIIAGDMLHNAMDGVAIAAAFLVSVPTGIVTTLAVAAHEIPQEIGDFGLLLHKGLPRRRVLFVNIISALATTVTAVAVFALGWDRTLPIGVLLGVSAGFLLYIAMSDVIPEIHENAGLRKIFDLQPMFLLLGVLVVGLAINISHGFIDESGRHTEEGCTTVYEEKHDFSTVSYEACDKDEHGH